MRRVAALTAALFACALAPAGASAASWIVSGAGFGHGVGMSQYGAYGFARHGWDYSRILGWYYRGTQLGQANNGSVRVLLASGQRTVTISGAKQVDTRALQPSTRYAARASGGSIVVRDSRGHTVWRAARPQFWASGSGVSFGGKRYRGAIEVDRGLDVIN